MDSEKALDLDDSLPVFCDVLDSEEYDDFEEDWLSEEWEIEPSDPSDGFVVVFDQEDLDNDKPLSDSSFDSNWLP